jgi:hypothetical protein
LLEKQTPFVPLNEQERVVKVVDRVGIATEIALMNMRQLVSTPA